MFFLCTQSCHSYRCLDKWKVDGMTWLLDRLDPMAMGGTLLLGGPPEPKGKVSRHALRMRAAKV